MTRTTAARPRALLVATGLLAAAGVTLAATAAAAPSTGQRTGAGALGQAAVPSVTSENVKQIAGIPETTAISMEFARTGPFAYVSSLDTISVLDLTDPRDPQLRGTLVNVFFENEAMTYGERIIDGELTRFVIAAIDLARVAPDDPEHINVDEAQVAIIDVTDPDNPFSRSVTPTGRDTPGAITSSTHTVQCVDQLNCTTAYSAGGRDGFFSVLDFSDLDAPKEVGTVNSPAAGPNPIFSSGAGHYWDFDGVLGWHTGSGGSAAFDVSDPRKPLLVNASNEQGIEAGLNDFIEHNSMRPNATKFKPNTEPSVMNGNVLLVTEEDYTNDGDEVVCDRAGSFQTWYIDELDGEAYRAKNPDGTKVGVGSISNLDATNAPAEFGGGATTPATGFCSAHWFDYHQDGFVAQGWYGAGLRILDVRDAREIKQVGFATGGATQVWDAYWVPQRDAAGVSIPGQKTNIVYTADAVRGIEVFEVTLPTDAASPSPSASASPTASTSASPSMSASASPSTTPSGSMNPTGNPSPSASNTASAGRFHPLTPARIFDSREAPNTRIQAGADRRIQVSGQGGIPTSGVSAVVLNVTEVLGSTRGDLQVYPTGQQPAERTSNLNYFRGEAVPVQVQLGLGTGGGVTVSVNTGSADVIVDVFGWYGDESDNGGDGYTAINPNRLLDTRNAGQTPVRAGNDQIVQVTGRSGVPANATAVAFNTTVLDTPANADLQVYPADRKPQQRTSNVNVRLGQAKANAVVTDLSANGQVGLSISQNQASVVLDVLGFYSPSSPGRFIPLRPQRIFDTRNSSGFQGAGTAVGTSQRTAQVEGNGGVPTSAIAAMLSVTATGAGQSLDLSVIPAGRTQSQRTSTSNLRPAEAVANLAPATLSSGGAVSMSVSRSQAQVILDVVGYFTN